MTAAQQQSKTDRRPEFWMRLDNAAKIYPAVQSEELTSVFRLSCVLKDRIRIKPLLDAIHLIEDRFPYFKVKPKKGFFWYYLEFHNEPIPLKPDRGTPCRAFGKDELVFRILARNNVLSVEFSHIITDGSGGFEFLKTLLLTYLELCCLVSKADIPHMLPHQSPAQDEFEDGFSRYFQKDIPSPKKKPKAFHLPFKLNNEPRFKILIAKVSLNAIQKKSKENKVSITEYLVAVYLYALQCTYNNLSTFKKQKARKIFRVQVPVNLRKIYGSKTMRNFSLFVTPEIDLALGSYTFEEIVKTVHHIMQLETDKKLINKMIARNVGAERNMLLKSTPLFLKSLILNLTYSIAGTSRYSGVITNLGKVSLGDADKHIDHFVFIPPPPNKALRINCGVLGFGDSLLLSFGNITRSKELEREFLRFLVKQDIDVKLIKY